MTALVFPSSPTAGQEFTGPNNVTYTYDGVKWIGAVNRPNGSETKVEAGTNVTVTGTGTTADPYVVNATGGGDYVPTFTVAPTTNQGVSVFVTAQGYMHWNGSAYAPDYLIEDTTSSLPWSGSVALPFGMLETREWDYINSRYTITKRVWVPNASLAPAGVYFVAFPTAFPVKCAHVQFNTFDADNNTYNASPLLVGATATGFRWMDNNASSNHLAYTAVGW